MVELLNIQDGHFQDDLSLMNQNQNVSLKQSFGHYLLTLIMGYLKSSLTV